MLPIIPHFSQECLVQLGVTSEINWPIFDQNLDRETICKFVVQINGKKRGLIEAEKNSSEEYIVKKIRENQSINKFLKDEQIKKTIFVSNRLINFII